MLKRDRRNVMRLTPVRTAATAMLAAALLTAASVAQAAHNPYHPYQPSPVVKTGRATLVTPSGTAPSSGEFTSRRMNLNVEFE